MVMDVSGLSYVGIILTDVHHLISGSVVRFVVQAP